jgi:hypothetical protein
MTRSFLAILLAMFVAAPAIAQSSASFQQDVNGYLGTLDTELRTQSPSTPRGSNPEITIDNDDDGHQTQGALRFENLFSSQGGPVPSTDVLIAFASLRLYVTSGSDPGAVISFHRVLPASPWSESSTWANLGGDLTPDPITGELDGDPILQNDIESLIVPDGVVVDPEFSDGFIEIDVRTSVAAWFNGATNLGWAINNSTGGGWDFLSSEFVDPLEPADFDKRPKLTIGWVIEPGDIDGDLDVDLDDFQDLLENLAIQLDGPIEPGHPGDLDFDRDVDLDDFALFKGYYLAFPGNGGLAALNVVLHGVPEPSALALAMAAIALGSVSRRRKSRS